MKVGSVVAGGVVGALCGMLLAQSAGRGTTRSAPPSGNIPEAEFIRLGKLFQPPAGPSEAERQKAYLDQMNRFLQQGRVLEARYPKAANLYVLRLGMLRAAGILFADKKDAASRRQVMAIAQSTLDNPAPLPAKVYPDRVVTAERIQPPGQSPAADADELIRAFVQRYHKTPAAPQALMEGYRLAVQIRNVKVAGEFVTTLEKDHADAAGVFRFLAEIGRRPLFQAELTRLDGTRLLLPADVKGKIVVIEFWATWDPACATNQPVMRKVYARYKDKGVEIVGINLDTPGRLEELKQYVKDAGLPWTQTYSGLFRDDPAARKCSIEAVPSVWVLDREGRVISAGAGEDLSRTLDLALAEGR